jgi:hypothetical protein
VIILSSKFESRLELWTPAGMVGVLRKAFDVQVSETLNGEYFVQFLYPKEPGDEERYNALTDGGMNEVRFPADVENGQHFRILRVEEVRDKRRVYKLVEAHHVALTLSQYYLDEYIDFQAAVPPETLLGKLGSGTPFNFFLEGSFTSQDVFEWGEKSRIDLLQEARELYGAELSFDNYDITFTTRKGENRNVSIRYRKNLNGIKRTSHSMERITRLYGYGKNGLTIEGYQGRTDKYIDSEYFDPNNPYMGKMEWPEIEDQGALLVAMQQYLKKHETPKVSYEIDMVELFKVDPDAFAGERIGVGDTVAVFDEALGYAFDARVHRYIRYPFEPKRGSVTLANFREYKTSDYIFQATVGSKKAITYTTKNAVLKGVKYDDSLTLVDGMGMKVTDPQNVERVRIGQIGPGRYGLRVDSGYIEIVGKLPDSQIASAANWNGKTTLLLPNGIYTGTVRATQIIVGEAGEKIGDNLIDSAATWNGKTTLLTPSGIYTGTIQANQINAATLSAITANLGTVTAGTIQGVTISGGTITGALIQGAIIQTSALGRRIVLSDAFRSYDSNNVVRISIEDFPGYNYHQLQFFGEDSIRTGVISGTTGQFNFGTFNNSIMVFKGTPIVIDASTTYINFSNVPVYGLRMSVDDITGLSNRLQNIENNIMNLWTALDSKASKGALSGLAGPFNGGIPIGTNIQTTTGVVTWAGIPAHGHVQT